MATRRKAAPDPDAGRVVALELQRHADAIERWSPARAAWHRHLALGYSTGALDPAVRVHHPDEGPPTADWLAARAGVVAWMAESDLPAMPPDPWPLAQLALVDPYPRALRRIPAAILAEPAEPDWFAGAVCRAADPEVWFDTDPTAAIRVCRLCPSAGDCAEYGIAEQVEFGVWGGLTVDDRRQVAAHRGIVWEADQPPARPVCSCGRPARPQRSMCSACQQRHYRASRR